MSNIKVLELPRWAKASSPMALKHRQMSLDNLEEITPRFNRDGVYKHNGKPWIEVEGRAYYYDSFDYDMEKACYSPLSYEERKLDPRILKNISRTAYNEVVKHQHQDKMRGVNARLEYYKRIKRIRLVMQQLKDSKK